MLLMKDLHLRLHLHIVYLEQGIPIRVLPLFLHFLQSNYIYQ
jgi:hypothetical protein